MGPETGKVSADGVSRRVTTAMKKEEQMTYNTISYDTILSLSIGLLLMVIIALAIQNPPVDAAANHINTTVHWFSPSPNKGRQVSGATARRRPAW